MATSATVEPAAPSRFALIVYIVAALVALIGLAESTYLTVMSLAGETLVCGGSSSCFQVLGSQWSHIGPVPLAGFGALAYYCVFTFAVFAAFRYRRARLLFMITVWCMFAVTLGLLYLQAFVLHAFCRYCLVSAALIFLLAGMVVASPPPVDD